MARCDRRKPFRAPCAIEHWLQPGATTSAAAENFPGTSRAFLPLARPSRFLEFFSRPRRKNANLSGSAAEGPFYKSREAPI